MKWTVLLLGILIFSVPVYAELDSWGCCIPASGTCFDGSAFDTDTLFQSSCDQAGGRIEGAGVAATCNGYSECTIGCCCAGETVFDSPVINSNENLLKITQNECDLKEDDYEFNDINLGDSCVEICGGVPPEEPLGSFTVSGTVTAVETGDPVIGATAFIPVPEGTISDVTGASGTFSLYNVPEIYSPVYVVHDTCDPGQSEPISVEADVEGVSVSIVCEAVACDHLVPEFLSPPQSVSGTSEVEFTMQLEDSCNDFLQFEPKRCNDQFQNCLPLVPTTSPAIRDTDLQPDTMYCYVVDARFADGTTTGTGDVNDGCVTTGSEICLERDSSEEWCGQDDGQQAVLSCDENNVLNAAACEDGYVCSERSGEPECVPAPPCDLCNGLLGLFPDGDWLISPDDIVMETCEAVCMLDSVFQGKPLMVDAYSTCLTVSECYNYRSEDSCSADECGLDAGCDWVTVNEEIGQGICGSPEAPACERCEEFFGYCNTEACSFISPECYFDGEENNLAFTLGCISKENMACRYYDTEEDCTNAGANAVFDITYENGTRDSGTNARTTDSADLLGIGACTWTGTFCIKDADMVNEGEDDCIESGRIYTDPDCPEDSTPPTTTFYPKLTTVPPIYGREEIRTLPFSVYDEGTAIDELTTYVCFHMATDEQCYPTETLSELALPEEGEYTMRYFSMDMSENSEVIQEFVLLIQETAEPALEDANIEENE